MVITIIDYVCFILIASSVAYATFFTIAAKWYKEPKKDNLSHEYSFLVLIPAYQEDKLISHTVKAALRQKYDKHKFEICVISDQMKNETNQEIKALGASLLKVGFSNSSKAKAMNVAMKYYKNANFDFVVILDADNIICNNYLSEINLMIRPDTIAIQTRRFAKHIETATALLDAVSEEINNTIFRLGHTAINLSSALTGSGMIFSFNWFKNHIQQVVTAGEDKEIELLLLEEDVKIYYSNETTVLDEKTSKQGVFYKQRRRWIAAQFGALKTAIKNLPKAIKSKNINYIDKMVQWIMPSRLMVLGFITLFTAITPFFPDHIWIKWIILWIIFVATLFAAIPKFLLNKKLLKAIIVIPHLFILMFSNMFRLKGVNQKFIHTEK